MSITLNIHLYITDGDFPTHVKCVSRLSDVLLFNILPVSFLPSRPMLPAVLELPWHRALLRTI